MDGCWMGGAGSCPRQRFLRPLRSLPSVDSDWYALRPALPGPKKQRIRAGRPGPARPGPSWFAAGAAGAAPIFRAKKLPEMWAAGGVVRRDLSVLCDEAKNQK